MTVRRRYAGNSPTMLGQPSLTSTTFGAALDTSISRSTTAMRMSATRKTSARITASLHLSTAFLSGTLWCPSAGTGAGPHHAEEELESATRAAEAGGTKVAKSVGEARHPGIPKNSATTDVSATVVKAVGVVEAQLPEIAKCRATTVFDRTGFNNVLLCTTVVPIPGGCAKTFLKG